MRRGFTLSALLLAGLALLPGITHGTVVAEAAMTIDNLVFSSSDSAATLVWTDEWQGIVHAQAHDSLSGTDAEDDSIISDNAGLAVNATTALADATGTYNVVNGPQVGLGGGDIEIITGAGLEIIDVVAQASAEAVGTFDNPFMITGGTPGSLVDVMFELDFVYLLDASADFSGFFEVFVFATLQIEDFADLGDGDIDNVDDVTADFILRTESGTNRAIFELVSGTLTVFATLEYGKEYLLFAEADSEVFGTNVPEPALPGLLLAGLLLLGYRVGKTRLRTGQLRASY